MLEGEGKECLIKESSTKAVETHQDLEKPQLIKLKKVQSVQFGYKKLYVTIEESLSEP